MVATLILERGENGDLHDQGGHLRNAAVQRLDDQRAVIPDQDDDIATDDAARPRTSAEAYREFQWEDRYSLH
uniref:Uncharacterized protein n=1 Tax=Brassica oleracea TaxID=3712 RepID=A0A3P6FNQ2_BRAOL|nr:unnamed protein product [Brassica oleracea]